MITLGSGIEIDYVADLSTLDDIYKRRILEWAEFLLKGGTTQAVGILKNEYGMCALGAACEVAKEGVSGKWVGIAGDVGYSFQIVNGHGITSSNSGLPPEQVCNYYGVSLYERKFSLFRKAMGTEEHKGFRPKVVPPGIIYDISVLNDDLYATFEEIANILRVAVNGGFGGR